MKLGSPYVNAMIVAGAVVFYITVILFGVDENVASSSTVDNLCQTRIWMVAIGFSLLYGTMFAKTWRIYFIFNHAKPNTKLVCKYEPVLSMQASYLISFAGNERHLLVCNCWSTCSDRYCNTDPTNSSV